MRYCFDEYEIDTERFEVRHRGERQAVEPQVFDVLAYLAANNERLVTKEELLDNIWGDRFVSESALTSRLKSARRALGDDGRTQRVIRTVHGRGYQFIAPLSDQIDPASETAAPPPSPSPSHGTSVPEDPAAGRDELEGGWPLLGRSALLEQLADWATGSRCGGAVLTGEAGIGKTRLGHEMARAAEAAGVTVARAAGHPESSSLPLAALAHLLPSDVASSGGDGNAPLDRATVFHRARAAFETQQGPRILLVDDADQLDDLSLALIVSMVSTGTAFVVATIRSGGEPVPALANLVKDGQMRLIELPPLTESTMENLLYRALGGPMRPATVTTLCGAALGNPGVLRQLVESSIDAGTLVEDRGVWHLVGELRTTATLQELVADRLSGLEGAQRQAVELLAVAGSLGLEVLEDLVGPDALDELDRRSLLDLLTQERRTDVRLAHPLFGEVLREHLPPLRGRRLRAELAGAVEQRGARRRDDRLRLVAWRLDAGGTVDTDALLDAVRLALVERDERTAQRLLERASRESPSARVQLLDAELAFRRGDAEQVEALLGAIALEDLEVSERARAIRRRANNLLYGLGRYSRAAETLAAGIATLPDGDDRRTLEAHQITMSATMGPIAKAVDRSEALLAGTEGPARLELLRARSLALMAAGRGEEALAAIEEGRTLHRDLPGDLARPGLTMLLFCELVVLTDLGRLAEASAALERGLLDRSLSPDQGWVHTGAARLYLLQGRTELVRATLDPLIRTSRALGHGATERWVLALHAHSLVIDGQLDAAADALDRVASLEVGERGLFHNEIDRAHAWLVAARGDTAGACTMLLTSADHAVEDGKRSLELALVHDAARLGDAGQVVARMRSLGGLMQGELPAVRVAHVEALAAGDGDAMRLVAERFDRLGVTPLAVEAMDAATADPRPTIAS